MLKDLIFKKGKGAGLLEDAGTEHSLNVNMIKIIKQLDMVDKEAREKRKNQSYESYLSSVRTQLQLSEQITHYAIVRMIKAENNYRGIEQMLSTWQQSCDTKEKQVRQEELKLRDQEKSENPAATMVRTQIEQYKSNLKAHRMRIQKLRMMINEIKSNFKDKCKNTFIKIKKAEHLA